MGGSGRPRSGSERPMGGVGLLLVVVLKSPTTTTSEKPTPGLGWSHPWVGLVGPDLGGSGRPSLNLVLIFVFASFSRF